MKRGSYYGTEIDGKWWRRYRAAGFFARGNGELWLDATGLHFRKVLTRVPLSISWDEVTAFRLAKWHCGRPGYGHPLLKVDFVRAGMNLTAGFRLPGDPGEMERFVEDLGDKLNRR